MTLIVIILLVINFKLMHEIIVHRAWKICIPEMETTKHLLSTIFVCSLVSCSLILAKLFFQEMDYEFREHIPAIALVYLYTVVCFQIIHVLKYRKLKTKNVEAFQK